MNAANNRNAANKNERCKQETNAANKQKAVANCVWMLVVKIEGIERIY